MQKETCDIWRTRNPEVTCCLICQVYFSRFIEGSGLNFWHALLFWLIVILRQIITPYKVTNFWILNNFMSQTLLLIEKKILV